MTPIGPGLMDFLAIVEAGAGHTEWMIVEPDRCDTDMVEAVQQSVDCLVGEGLARGNKQGSRRHLGTGSISGASERGATFGRTEWAGGDGIEALEGKRTPEA